MRVLQLGKFYPVEGGVEKVMFDLLVGLSNKNIPCDMLCTNVLPGKPAQTVEINKNARIYCTKTILKKFSTMISPQLVTKLREIGSNYDIIHVHHPDPMAAVALRCSGFKGKVVLHWHSDILSQKILLNFYMPLQKWLIKRADVIVGTTPVYIEKSPHLRFVQHKCTYLPIGVQPIVCDEAKAAKIRNRYKNKKIVFSLGRLVAYKGFKYLIDAARNLPNDYVVLIGGSGELKEQLRQQITDLHLENKVYLLGRISDEELPLYFKACDLFCLSSIQKTEAFAIVQIEAMSCGKPVVATKIPESGVSWVNAHGQSGLNVPIEDADALATAITSILDNEPLYQTYSQGAWQRFHDLFRIDEMITKCERIYANL